MAFINEQRLKNYPLIFLLTTWSILILNIILGHGWISAMGKIIGSDFLMLYTAGRIYKENPTELYNLSYQWQVEESLLAPTPLPGIAPHNYPPYTALLFSVFTYLPPGWALALWSVMSIGFVALSVFWMERYLTTQKLRQSGLTYRRLLIIVLSFFPLIEGLQVGQNHALTLFLFTGMLVFTIRERWEIAGALAGLSIYKPQLVVGFLIFWLISRRWKALFSFSMVAIAWAGIVVLQHGMIPYLEYLNKIPEFVQMLSIDGFGGFLEVTPYGLMITLFPEKAQPLAFGISQFITIAVTCLMILTVIKFRKDAPCHQIPVLLLAGLYPFLASPHGLLHDLLVLAPLFLLWASRSSSPWVLYSAVSVYVGSFVLIPIAYYSGIAWLAIIPFALLLLWFRDRDLFDLQSSQAKNEER